MLIVADAFTQLVVKHATWTERNKHWNKHSRFENPNWREADQLASYKHDQEVELAST